MNKSKFIDLCIGGVDGETWFNVRTSHYPTLRKFLNDYDHEGSVVTIAINGEDFYNQKAFDKLKELGVIE